MLGCTPDPEFGGGIIRRVDDEAITGFVVHSLNSITAMCVDILSHTVKHMGACEGTPLHCQPGQTATESLDKSIGRSQASGEDRMYSTTNTW